MRRKIELTIPLPDFSRYKGVLLYAWLIALTVMVVYGLYINVTMQTVKPSDDFPAVVQKSVQSNLSFGDRQSIKAAVDTVLSGSQETAAEVREDLRYQIQGLTLSPSFDKFNADWQAALNKAPPSETVEDVKKKLTILRDNL